MALTYSQWIWGFEVFDSGSNQNNQLDFSHGTTKVATLNAGVYTADEFQAEVARALIAADSNSYTCVFDYSTLTFTIAGTATFSLLFGSGTNSSRSPANLLGWTKGGGSGNDKTGGNTYGPGQGAAAVGVAPSSASVWTAPSEVDTRVLGNHSGGRVAKSTA